MPSVEPAYSQASRFLFIDCQCPYEKRNRGRLLSASARVGLFKGRFILDYEQKIHMSLRVMETNPPGANRPLTNLAPSCSYSVKENSATLLFWVLSNFKSNTMVVWRYMKPLISPKSNQLRFYVSTSRFPKRQWSWFEPERICYQAIFFRGKSADASQTKREEGPADRRLNQNLPLN